MKVVLSPEARDDLRAIQTYIAYDNVSAAARVASRIRSAVSMLQDHPKIGRVYEDGPERRLAVPQYPYCIYYQVDEAAQLVTVSTILHTSRIPPSFG